MDIFNTISVRHDKRKSSLSRLANQILGKSDFLVFNGDDVTSGDAEINTSLGESILQADLAAFFRTSDQSLKVLTFA